jgi:hypothetical protein
MELTREQAIEINQWIDVFHNPSQWAYIIFVAAFISLESFTPGKEQFTSRFDKYLVYTKFMLLVFLCLVVGSQGFFGGCIVQLPQNWIAQEYLDRPYWYPYGLVYREELDESLWPLLRLLYLVLAIFFIWRTVIFYRKFIKIPKEKMQTNQSSSEINHTQYS